MRGEWENTGEREKESNGEGRKRKKTGEERERKAEVAVPKMPLRLLPLSCLPMATPALSHIDAFTDLPCI